MPSTEPEHAITLLPSGVPPRLRHCVRSEWEGDFPEIDLGADLVLIHGPAGAGKSHIAIAAAAEMMHAHGIKSGRGNLWHRDADSPTQHRVPYSGAFWRDVQESVEHMKSGHEDRDELDTCLGCELLVYDDLGAERLTDFVLDRISLVLRHRYNHMLRTIVTTNLAPSAIHEIDPRLASRLCSGVVVKRTGEDRRLA